MASDMTRTRLNEIVARLDATEHEMDTGAKVVELRALLYECVEALWVTAVDAETAAPAREESDA